MDSSPIATTLLTIGCAGAASRNDSDATVNAAHASCALPTSPEQPGAHAIISVNNNTGRTLRFWHQTSEVLPVVHFSRVQEEVLSNGGKWARSISLASFEAPTAKVEIKAHTRTAVYAYVQGATIKSLRAGQRVRLVISDLKWREGILVELDASKLEPCRHDAVQDRAVNVSRSKPE